MVGLNAIGDSEGPPAALLLLLWWWCDLTGVVVEGG